MDKTLFVKLPTDRPYDGVDQTEFLLGKQTKSNREHLISFTENEISAVRWRHYRFYLKAFVASFGNPSQEGMMGLILEKAGAPDIYNIEADPREQSSLSGTHGWLLRYIWPVIAEYNQSLKKYPNPPGVYMTGTDVANKVTCSANKTLQRIAKSVAIFAEQKYTPLLATAEL